MLGAGLFEGKIRAVVSTLDGRARGVTTDKVVIKPGQMKLFYVLDGTVGLRYNGERHSSSPATAPCSTAGCRMAGRISAPGRPVRSG